MLDMKTKMEGMEQNMSTKLNGMDDRIVWMEERGDHGQPEPSTSRQQPQNTEQNDGASPVSLRANLELMAQAAGRIAQLGTDDDDMDNTSLFRQKTQDGRRLEAAMLQRRGKAFRPGTQANHRSVAQLYAAFALHFQTPDFPATVSSLLLFAEFLLRTYRAHRSVVNALSSLRTFHLVRGLPMDAFADYQLTLYKRALPLTVRHVPQGAAPLPFQLLEQLCSLAGAQGPAGVAFAALMAATFFSMARLSSLAPPTGGDHYDITRFPTWHDLTQAPNGVTLRIKWAKNRQEAGHSIAAPLLPLAASPACPVQLFSRLAAQRAAHNPAAPLFGFPAVTGASSEP